MDEPEDGKNHRYGDFDDDHDRDGILSRDFATNFSRLMHPMHARKNGEYAPKRSAKLPNRAELARTFVR